MRDLIRSPLYTFQTKIVPFQDPDAKYSPSGENATLATGKECPMRVMISYPLDAFHTLIEQSSDPEAKYSPFGENTTLFT